MGKLSNSAYRTRDREYNLLLASGLLCSYGRSTPDELYRKAIKCFEVLIDILEDTATAEHIAALTGRPATAVQDSARTIIDLLLFNKGADPSVSLGLPENTDRAEATRRWKRLMVLYHPDRYPDNHEYEEKAKKINEAHEKLQQGGGKRVYALPDQTAAWSEPPGLPLSDSGGVSRRVPVFVLALALFVLVITLWLFISI
ncbi:MAG: hypothetical protein C0402_07365 [Thermodesulfovibrio sp.]|nr:hypothetical protein [Thermodesulfovibrio sp.]